MNRARFISMLVCCAFVTACGAATPSHGNGAAAATGVRNISTAKHFHPPTTVQAPVIANDSPGQSWNFPNDPALVMQKIYKWLSTASVTTVRMPKSKDSNVSFMDYMGPSELYFNDQSGVRILVEPAYYIAHGNHGYHPSLIHDVVMYKVGKQTVYLKSPSLFQWLAQDKNWEADFRMEFYTSSEQKAITYAKKSKWGGHFTDIFPALPGIKTRTFQPRGTKSTTPAGTVNGTVETRVNPSGTNQNVTFIEVWDHGMHQHQWHYEVSSNGTVVAHSQKGS